MSSTESLRDLYHRESSATWAFDLPIDLPVVSSSGKMALENGTKSSGPEWATRSPSRLLLDLSGQEDSDVTTQAVLKGFAAAVVLQCKQQLVYCISVERWVIESYRCISNNCNALGSGKVTTSSTMGSKKYGGYGIRD